MKLQQGVFHPVPLLQCSTSQRHKTNCRCWKSLIIKRYITINEIMIKNKSTKTSHLNLLQEHVSFNKIIIQKLTRFGTFFQK